MSGSVRFAYLMPLATVALALGCVTSPVEPEVIGADSGQGGRPTYGTPKEVGLVEVLAKDEQDFKLNRPRPRGGTEIKANHSPRPKGQITVGDIPLVGATPSGPPSISGTPTFHVRPKDPIFISGENFGINTAVVTVSFPGAKDGDKEVQHIATIVTLTNDKVEVVVPDGAVDGPIKIKVGDRDSVSSPFSFDIVGATAPTVSAITPELGKAGDVLTITGTNFGTVKGDLEIAIGTTKLLESQVNEVSDTQIKVTVPDGFTDGPVIVTKLIKADNGNITRDGGRSLATFKKQT